MPQASLQSPPLYQIGPNSVATPGAAPANWSLVAAPSVAYVPITNPNNVGNTPDNTSIALPGFLAGVISVEIQSSSVPGAAVVVEGQMYPGDYVPLWLMNPEKGPVLPNQNADSFNEGGSQLLEGPRACGSARCWAYGSVRIRRTDLNGGLCNVWFNFREGAY